MVAVTQASQAANAKGAAYYFSFNPKQQMVLLRPLIPNYPTKKAKRKFVPFHINQLGTAGKLLPHTCNTGFCEQFLRMKNSWINVEKIFSRLPPPARALNHWNLLSWPKIAIQITLLN